VPLTVTPSNEYFGAPDHPILQTIGAHFPTLIVEWDKAPGLFWVFRLAEGWGDGHGGWLAMPAADWQRDGESNLRYTDGRVAFEEELDEPLVASLSTKVEDDALRWSISLRNDTDTAHQDCWAHLCLIHRWAQAFQANCELPTGAGDDLYQTPAALPARNQTARWIKGCAIRDRQDLGARLGRSVNPNGFQEEIVATHGTVRAWRVHEHGTQQLIELHSPDALLLAWSHWPCTDMTLHFGTLGPGERSTAVGTLRFFEREFEIAR